MKKILVLITLMSLVMVTKAQVPINGNLVVTGYVTAKKGLVINEQTLPAFPSPGTIVFNDDSLKFFDGFFWVNLMKKPVYNQGSGIIIGNDTIKLDRVYVQAMIDNSKIPIRGSNGVYYDESDSTIKLGGSYDDISLNSDNGEFSLGATNNYWLINNDNGWYTSFESQVESAGPRNMFEVGTDFNDFTIIQDTTGLHYENTIPDVSLLTDNHILTQHQIWDFTGAMIDSSLVYPDSSWVSTRTGNAISYTTIDYSGIKNYNDDEGLYLGSHLYHGGLKINHPTIPNTYSIVDYTGQSFHGLNKNRRFRITENLVSIEHGLAGSEVIDWSVDTNGVQSVLGKKMATENYVAATFDSLDMAETVSRTIYVATTGNDVTGDGSVGNPYATLLKAYKSIKSNINSGLTITISPSAGTYSLDLSLYDKEMQRINGGNGSQIKTLGSVSSYASGFTLTAGSPDAYVYTISGYSPTANDLQGKFLLVSGSNYPIASNNTTTINANIGNAAATTINSLEVTINLTGQYFYPTFKLGYLQTANIVFEKINFVSTDVLRFFPGASTLLNFTECCFNSNNYYSLTNYGHNTEFQRCAFITSITSQIFAIVSDNFLFQDCVFVKTGTRAGIGWQINNNTNSKMSYVRLYGNNYISNVLTGIAYGYGYYLHGKHRTVTNNSTVIDATSSMLVGTGTSIVFYPEHTLYVLNSTTLLSERTYYGYDQKVIIPTLVGTYTNLLSTNLKALGLVNIPKNINTYIQNVPTQGTATLVAGTVTINTAAVQTGSEILVSCKTPGGTQGFLSIGTITAGTSFVINSSSNTDTSVILWQIVK